MNHDQAAGLIRQTFTHSFDKNRYLEFSRNLLNHIDEEKASAWNSQYVKDAFKEHIQRYERLGTYTSPDDDKLDVLIVYLTRDSKLQRARTAFRNFVADHLKTRDEKEAALVAFVSPSETTWRYSYVKMEYAAVEKESGKVGVETRLTPARRFSYIVGEGESCHTAQTRFVGLLQDTDTKPSLARIEEAFSVEAVTKEFFLKYAELFELIEKALRKLVDKDKTIRDEFKAKGINTVDFAKKLMGQIVFLYFLQKKGWLGVAKGQDWGTGPHDFLRRLAKGENEKYENFFNDVLEPLFYDTLATDRGHEAWCSRFKCRIPFLNGGLFEPLGNYDWSKADIILPNTLFTNTEYVEVGISGTGVLDVFDRYNFTVNEAEPLEKEVAIDPEMLGKVFENLIEENRRKGLGAYYTPREIVHYMCQESLINYLDGAVNIEAETVPRADIETFVYVGEQYSFYEAAKQAGTIGRNYPKPPKTIEQHARLIDERLAGITVCDPAVGSGAFPVGMMTEVVRARCALTPYFNDIHERTPYYFKRHAIQSCLYGVDIDPGAVEIAKLRLWLSLVVDEEDVQQIKPLPNLDYKVVVGNSLLGVEKNLFNQEQFKRLEELKPKFFNESDRKKKVQFKRQIEDLIHELTNGREAFDFEIYFSEVFHVKRGFDVVLANPPYVSVEKFARTALQTEWKRKFKTYASRGDIYCFFYEQGLALLRDGGVLTFISSNKFQRAGYGKSLRQLLASERIHALIDFCELPVFAAATDPMIVIVAKAAATPQDEFPVLVVKDEAEFGSLRQSLAARASRYKPDQLKAEGWSLEGVHGLALLEKIRAKGTPLGDYVKGRFYYGIKTCLNEAFVIDRPTRDRLISEDRKSAELIKPWIRGKDIKRWVHTWNNSYLIQIASSENTRHPWSRMGEKASLDVFKKTYPAIARHLLIFEQKLRKRIDQGTHFWELRSCDYWATFKEDRVLLPIIKKTHGFSFVKGIGYSNDKTTFFISPEALFLLAVLNSLVVEWLVRMEFPVLGDPWSGGRIEYRAVRVKGLPIPPASATDKSRLTKLAERATELAAADDGAGVAKVDREIDKIVYSLFDLTPDEISQIEHSLATTRGRTTDGDDEDEEDK